MKKLLSIVLAALMAFSMFATVSAATVEQVTGGGYQGVDGFPAAVSVSVTAVKQGSGDSPASSVVIPDADFPATFDYTAKLDMSGIVAVFNNTNMAAIKAASDFDSGTVTSNITVDIRFPSGVSVPSSAGSLTQQGGIFTEVSRDSVAANVLRITYANTAVTAGELADDVRDNGANGYLKDIIFTLTDVTYTNADEYIVYVDLYGYTDIKFNNGTTGDESDDYTQRISYRTMDNACTVRSSSSSSSSSAGGGSGIAKYSVKFNTNGGTDVDNISVVRGNKIEAPVTTKEGYKFDGWYSDGSFRTLFDFEKGVYGNVTLYAKWVEEGTDVPVPGDCDGNGLGCAVPHYDDITAEAWYHEDVDYVVGNGLMKGVEEGTFAPDVPLTRAMIVTILWRQEGSPAPLTESEFTDITDGDYYEDAVKWADENGIVLGYTDTMFGPDNNITREQLAAILYRYANYKEFDVSVGENTNILSYEDYSDISEYAISAMQYAVGSGLMNGRTESTLNPNELTTRAEAAAMIHRFFTKIAPVEVAE